MFGYTFLNRGGTTYPFRVSGRGDGVLDSTSYGSTTSTSGSTYSCPRPTPTPVPPPPTPVLEVSATSQTSITLRWDARAGVSYTLQYSSDGGSTWHSSGDPIAGRDGEVSKEVTLACGTAYSFRARGRGTGSPFSTAYSPWSSTESGRTTGCDPPQPIMNAIGATTQTSITVSWTLPPGSGAVASYKLERSADNDNTTWPQPNDDNFPNYAGHVIEGITETMQEVTGLTCGVTYYFRVSARGGGSTTYADAHGTPSHPPAAGSTSACTRLAPKPTGLAATPTAQDEITVSWDTQTGVTAYKLERSDDGATWPDANAIAVTPTPGMNARTSQTVDNLTCSTTYHFRVSGKGDGSDYITDYGEPSDPPATSSIPCPAPTPANVIATPIAQDKIKVSWDTQTGVTAYKLERSDDGGTTWPSANTVQVLPTPTSTSHEVTNLKCGTAFTFRVSGKGDGMAHSGITYSSFRFGEASDYTDPLAATATDFFCTPQNLSVTPLVQRKARLTWEAVANATRYEVEAYRVGEIGGWQPLPRSGAGLGLPNDEAMPTHEFGLDRIIGVWGLDDNDAFKFRVRAIVTGHVTDMIFSEEVTLVDSPILLINGDSTGRGSSDGKMVVKWAWDADYALNTYTIRYRKLPDNHHQIPTMGMAGWQPDSAASDMAWSAPPSVQPTPRPGVSLEYPITGLEQYKVYAVQLNYTTPTATYFSARERYVWPSNRAAGNGDRVATFPLNHPLSELTDETYRYRICLSTFSSDMNKQDAWKTFIEHALDQWELATNGLVTIVSVR